MTSPLSIFVEYRGDEADLIREAAAILATSFDREELDVGPIHRSRILDTEFVLYGDHGLDDDAGIRFSEYNYQIRMTPFRVGTHAKAFDGLYRNMALFLAERLSTQLNCKTLVVENLQHCVAEFGP